MHARRQRARKFLGEDVKPGKPCYIGISKDNGVLGEIAMTTLMANSAVAAETQNFVNYVDEKKIKAAFGGESGR